jgi:hypothetical protein
MSYVDLAVKEKSRLLENVYVHELVMRRIVVWLIVAFLCFVSSCDCILIKIFILYYIDTCDTLGFVTLYANCSHCSQLRAAQRPKSPMAKIKVPAPGFPSSAILLLVRPWGLTRMHYKCWYIGSVLQKTWRWLNKVETCWLKCNYIIKLLCLTGICILYEIYKTLALLETSYRIMTLNTRTSFHAPIYKSTQIQLRFHVYNACSVTTLNMRSVFWIFIQCHCCTYLRIFVEIQCNFIGARVI